MYLRIESELANGPCLSDCALACCHNLGFLSCQVLNSENRARNATSKKKAAVDEDDSGIDPVARTVLDKGTTEEEAQYMMTQLMNLV